MTRVPGSYPQALAFPLQLAVLTARGFPFPAVGVVHVANTVVQEAALSRRTTCSIWRSSRPTFGRTDADAR